jgi:hypothetical protein
MDVGFDLTPQSIRKEFIIPNPNVIGRNGMTRHRFEAIEPGKAK